MAESTPLVGSVTERIRALDGVRGIAIVLVLAGHVVANFQPLHPDHRYWLGAFANSSAGVRLFFVLSGYLITWLLLREWTATGRISIGQFYRRRALRIFPAFYAYLFVITGLTFFRPTGVNGETFLAAATFTWNYHHLWISIPPEGAWNLGHLWTLALEQQFYLFWPALLVWAGRTRATWVAAALTLGCPIIRVLTHFFLPEHRGYTGMMFHTAIDGLMIGCAATLVADHPAIQTALHRHGKWLVLSGIAWLALASPTLAASVRGFPVVIGFTLDAIAAAWLILWLHRAAPPRATRWLEKGPLAALGTISYSLYLWQQLFLSDIGPLRHGQMLLPLVAAIVVATLSYRFIEQPFLRLKRPPPRIVPSFAQTSGAKPAH